MPFHFSVMFHSIYSNYTACTVKRRKHVSNASHRNWWFFRFLACDVWNGKHPNHPYTVIHTRTHESHARNLRKEMKNVSNGKSMRIWCRGYFNLICEIFLKSERTKSSTHITSANRIWVKVGVNLIQVSQLFEGSKTILKIMVVDVKMSFGVFLLWQKWDFFAKSLFSKSFGFRWIHFNSSTMTKHIQPFQ